MKKNVKIIFNNKLDIGNIEKNDIITILKKQAINICNTGSFDCCIIIGQIKKNKYVFLLSTTYMTRAGDLFRYLDKHLLHFEIENFEEGTDRMKVSSWYFTILNEESGKEMNEPLKIDIEKTIDEYVASATVIDGRTYYQSNADEIRQLPLYNKKSILRCYVNVSDIKKDYGLADEDVITLKTLENESGVALKAGGNDIIMIGSKGEPYNMPKMKFQELYQEVAKGNLAAEVSDEYEYVPNAFINGSEKAVDLLKYAYVCTSKKKNVVYAKKVTDGIYKVFSARIAGTNQYYYGVADERPFYLTVDKDDITSVHIIDADAFAKSYEMVVS